MPPTSCPAGDSVMSTHIPTVALFWRLAPGFCQLHLLPAQRGLISHGKLTISYVTISVGNAHSRFSQDCLRSKLLKYNLFVCCGLPVFNTFFWQYDPLWKCYASYGRGHSGNCLKFTELWILSLAYISFILWLYI